MIQSKWIRRELVRLLEHCAKADIEGVLVVFKKENKQSPLIARMKCMLENGRMLSGEALIADRNGKLMPIFAIVDDGKMSRTYFYDSAASTWST